MTSSCGVPESPPVAPSSGLESFTLPERATLPRVETSSDVGDAESVACALAGRPELPPPRAT